MAREWQLGNYGRVIIVKETMSGRARVVLLLACCVVLMLSCGGENGTGSADASCALSIEFDGRHYSDVPVEVMPPEGEIVGTGILPPCNDANDSDEEAEEIELARLPGVSPEVALVWPGRWDCVLVSEGTRRLPKEIRQLMEAPGCDPSATPIRLYGTWLGALGADGNTELDLVGPYDVEMVVSEASPDEYVGANLFVRVPKSLGKPLTHDDVEMSLWEGGDIEIIAECSPRGFTAIRVEAFPPQE